MKKNILTIALVLLLALAVIMPVFASDDGAQDENTTNYATAVDNTKEDCLKSGSLAPTISVDENHNITMTYKAASLKTVAKNDSDRPIDAAWIGYKLTTPKDATKYKVTYKGETTEGTITSSTVEDFVAVTAEKLAEVTKTNSNLVYTIEYEWFKNDSSTDEAISKQTLKIVIEPQGIELYDGITEENAGTVLWNEETYKENLPEEVPEQTPAATKDSTPKTGNENYLPALGIIAILTITGIVILKRN